MSYERSLYFQVKENIIVRLVQNVRHNTTSCSHPVLAQPVPSCSNPAMLHITWWSMVHFPCYETTACSWCRHGPAILMFESVNLWIQAQNVITTVLWPKSTKLHPSSTRVFLNVFFWGGGGWGYMSPYTSTPIYPLCERRYWGLEDLINNFGSKINFKPW